jgi:MFS family permease
MPQAMGALAMKAFMQRVLTLIGYRGVLVSNTIFIGLLILTFAAIGLHTPVWMIALLAFVYGAFSSLQYTSMNTLTYADTTSGQTSAASSIASTTQQMSISFGVAIAGLTTALFIPSTPGSQRETIIHGIHEAFLLLGTLTILSTIVFRSLRSGDGDDVSQHKAVHAE